MHEHNLKIDVELPTTDKKEFLQFIEKRGYPKFKESKLDIMTINQLEKILRRLLKLNLERAGK